MLTFLIISLSRLQAKKITPEVTRVAEQTHTHTGRARTHSRTDGPTSSHTSHLLHLGARPSDLFLSAWLPTPLTPRLLPLPFFLPLCCIHTLYGVHLRSSLWAHYWRVHWSSETALVSPPLSSHTEARPATHCVSPLMFILVMSIEQGLYPVFLIKSHAGGYLVAPLIR